MNVRTPLAALTLAAAAAVAAPPAGAVDETKPSPSCYGLAFTDKKGDQSSAAPGAQQGGRENLDLLGGFYKYDAAKADQATTFNLQIADLSTDIPGGATAVSWYISYGQAEGDSWLRALTDFTGVVSYEYGHFTILPTGTVQSVRDGSTQGAFFEGPDGVIQIVYPTDGPGKAGTTHKTATITAYEARQVLPGASPTPIKGGLLYEVDVAATKGTFTVGAPCPATDPVAPAPGAEQPGSGTQPLNSGGEPLPVKLRTTKVKARKARKTLKLKLSSSETITQLGAQVKKGKKVLGKGTLARLRGTGTIKVKLGRKLKKGAYQVDLVGTDSEGARRFTAAKLRIR